MRRKKRGRSIRKMDGSKRKLIGLLLALAGAILIIQIVPVVIWYWILAGLGVSLVFVLLFR